MKIYLIQVCIVLGISILIFSCGDSKNEFVLQDTFFTDLESTEKDQFVSEGGHFTKAKCQSQEKALSGKSSCKCSTKEKYGITSKLPNLKVGDRVISSIWVLQDKGSAALVFDAKKNGIYHSTSEGRKSIGKWDLLIDTIDITEGFVEEDVILYAYQTSNEGEIYLDDFKIEIYSSQGKNSPLDSQSFGKTTLEIKLTSENLKKIKKKREEAIERGLLFASKDDLVNADIRVEEQEFGVKMRLKGDLLDHLKGDNWSYRIESKGNNSWRGMKNFSIHNSEARSHVAEWIMHEIFRKEGIITPSYDFVEVKQNGKNLGMYAYEQHFDNALLKSNNRVVGPILRHTDDGYWENVQKEIKPFHWTKVSQIEVFNKENENDPNFVRLQQTGRSMLQDFIDGRKSADEVFDIDLLAKYYALLELGHALHAQQITNIRFYMNPSSGKLEPIGFDCFGDHLPKVTSGWTASGEGINDKVKPLEGYPYGGVYKYALFRDKNFFESYMSNLEEYTSLEYLRTIKSSFNDAAKEREVIIRSDKKYKDYTFDFDGLFKKAEFTRNKIYPLTNYSLKVYTENDTREKLKVQSFHYFPMEIIGFGNESIEDKLLSPLFLEAYNSKTQLTTYEVDNPNGFRNIFYKVLGIDSLFSLKISKLNAPNRNIEVVNNSIENLKNKSYLSISDKLVQFKAGDQTISEILVIPQGYAVHIPAGSVINFKGNGGLISYAPINAIGSKSQPIKFIGSKQNGNAVFVSGAEEESVFEHCSFIDLADLQYRNVKVDGGINAYNTRLNLKDCQIIDASGKDAIYAVNSSYYLKNVDFRNIQGDGIDAFQSIGKVDGASFSKVGRDALEIEGGELNGSNIRMNNVMSYGLKALERTSIYLHGLKLENGLYGLDISTGTKAKIINGNFKDVKRAVEVSGEKETCSLELVNAKFENVQQEYVIDRSAQLIINGSRKKPK